MPYPYYLDNNKTTMYVDGGELYINSISLISGEKCITPNELIDVLGERKYKIRKIHLVITNMNELEPVQEIINTLRTLFYWVECNKGWKIPIVIHMMHWDHPETYYKIMSIKKICGNITFHHGL